MGSRRLSVIIATLHAGGAERVATLLVNEWNRRDNQVNLITLDDGNSDHYGIATGVARTALNVMGHSQTLWQKTRRQPERALAIRRALKKTRPDVAIVFTDQTNILTLAASSGLKIPVIAYEQVDPRAYPLGKGWEFSRRRLYPLAAALVMQTERTRPWAEEHVAADKVAVIPNPVSPPASGEMTPTSDFPAKYIAAVGRLTHQKGFDMLLHAFAQVLCTVPDVHLVIAGEGSDRSALEQQAGALGIAQHVHLVGLLPNTYSLLAGCRCFVLSSRFEGIPNVLLEAMAVGCPVASFDCPTGPSELINHEQNGLLLPPENVAALSAAIVRLVQHPEAARRLGDQARVDLQRFSVEKVTDQWDALIQKVTNPS